MLKQTAFISLLSATCLAKFTQSMFIRKNHHRDVCCVWSRNIFISKRWTGTPGLKSNSYYVWISNCSNLDFCWIYIKTYSVLNLTFEFKLLCLFASLDETFISMKHLPCQTTRTSLLYTPIRVKVVSWNCELALRG